MRQPAAALAVGVLVVHALVLDGKADLRPGDILVADGKAGAQPAAVVALDLATGARTTTLIEADLPFDVEVDGFGDPFIVDLQRDAVLRVDIAAELTLVVSQGGSLREPRGLTVAPSGDILVVGDSNQSLPQLVRIDPATGAQTVVAAGGELLDPQDAVFDAAGMILVADRSRGVISVDPLTGAQTRLTPALSTGFGIAIRSDNAIFITGNRQVLRIDPVQGTSASISSGALLRNPTKIAFLDDTILLVADSACCIGGLGGILAIDTTSGTQAVLAQGFPLRGPRGIAVGIEGDLVTAQGGSGGALIAIDPTTGDQEFFTAGGQLGSPSRVDFDSRGNVFVLESASRLLRLDPNSGDISSAVDVFQAWDIATDVDGTAYYATRSIGAGDSPGIIRVDPDSSLQTLISWGGFLSGDIPGIEVTESGSVVAADPNSASLVLVDPLTGFQTLLASNLASFFDQEQFGLGLLGTQAYAADGWNGFLSTVDLQNGSTTGLGPLVPVGTQDIAIAESGSIYSVRREGDGSLVEVDPSTGAQTPVSTSLPRNAIVGLAIEASGDLLTIDERTDQILRVDRSTGSAAVVSTIDTEIRFLEALAVEPTGDVLVVDDAQDEVLRVDPTDGSWSVLSSLGPRSLAFIAVSGASGRIFVVELSPVRVLEIDSATGIESIVSDGGSLGAPQAIAVDAADNVWVAEAAGQLLLRIDSQTGDQEIVSQAGLFQNLSGVGIEQSGNVVVSDRSRRAVVRVDPNDGSQSILSETGELVDPRALTVDSTGRIVVLHPMGLGEVFLTEPPTVSSFARGGLLESPQGLGIVPATPCNDAEDNDLDGLTDHPTDPGCRKPFWPTENPACDDGLDNDDDGLVDWDGGGIGNPDPDCTAGWRDSEESLPGRCGLGVELSLVLSALALSRRRLATR